MPRLVSDRNGEVMRWEQVMALEFPSIYKHFFCYHPFSRVC